MEELKNLPATEAARQNRYQIAFELAAVGMAEVSPKGQLLTVNQAYAEMLGYSVAELQGKNDRDLTHPHFLDRRREQLENLSSGKIDFDSIEMICMRQDGSQIWVNLHSRAIRSPEGKIHYLVSAIQDVTEKKHAELALEESIQEFRLLAESTPQLLWTANPEGGITYVNRRCLDYSALPFEQLKGAGWLQTIHPDDLTLVIERWTFSLNTGEDYGIEFRMRRGSDQSYRWHLVRANPLRDPSGKILKWFGTATDIDDTKRTELLLQEQREKLVTSSKFSALGEMAGGIAHEINNPLAVIAMRAAQIQETLLEKQDDPEFITHALAEIMQTTTRIAQIVKALKSFSRDGKYDPMHSVSILSIIEDAFSLCQERFKNHQIELNLISEPAEVNALTIVCRSIEISQVLLNLLSNAFDAIQEKDANKQDSPHDKKGAVSHQKWVNVEVFDRGGKVEVNILDSGKGISPNIRHKLMQPFFTTKEIGKGTGLGLSISKGIMDSHRGTLSLDSSRKNTCFKLTLLKNQSPLELVKK